MNRRLHHEIIGFFTVRSPQANLIEHNVRFGRFVLDRARRELRCDGRAVALTGKAFDLLAILTASPQTAFSREELLDRLWADDPVEDGNLTQNIYLLRRALDPEGNGRAFIKTIPRYGYRFVHPIESANARHELRRRRPRAVIAVLLLVICALASSAGVAPLKPSPRLAEAQALGQYHLSLRGPYDLRTALRYFKEAVAASPDDAAGYAGAAGALALLAEYDRDGSPAQHADVARSKTFLHEAFAHDARNSEALAVAGFIAYRFQDDYGGARGLLRKAIDEDPSNGTAHLWYGVGLLAGGDLGGATREFETAHALQPASEVFSRWLARAYELGGRPNEAIATVEQALRIVPDDAAANLILASAEESRGDLNAALAVMHSLASRAPYERAYLIPSEARVRKSLREQVHLAKTAGLDPFETAVFYLSVGKEARAVALLRASHPSRIQLALEHFDPRLKRLRVSNEVRQLLAVTS